MPLDAERGDLALKVRIASRAIARHGLAHAYGHVSARLDDRRFVVSPAQPLGTVGIGDPCVVVPLEGDFPADVLGEVRIHRAIYRRRNDVSGVCRFQSPSVMALSALGETPRPLHGLGAYFAPGPPLWPDVRLVRDVDLADQVAEMNGANAAIVLRGKGAVTVGATLEEAAAFAFYLEDAARIEVALLPGRGRASAPRVYTPEEAVARRVKGGAIIERMWRYLCADDPEWS